MEIANVTKYCFEMQIPEISKLEQIWSPEMSIHGNPWEVQVCKKKQGAEQKLCFYLHCANKDESPNWSLSGAASFKLLPFTDDANPIEYHDSPNVFDHSGIGYGTTELIKWNDLFKPDTKYVKDDTINLEIKVMAENPNDANRSRLNFECVQKCCDDSYNATFRLTVTNIANLMAVQSPKFNLRGVPWNLQIFKTRSYNLDVLLQLTEESRNISCKTSIKLLSSKKNVQPIEKCDTTEYQYLKLKPTEVVSWNELMKPENGFVNNNSIVLEIEIFILGGDIANNMPIAKTPQMECSICFKCINNQDLSVTPCGHLFCLDCIEKAIGKRAVCPVCQKAVRLDGLRRLYLPVVN